MAEHADTAVAEAADAVIMLGIAIGVALNV